MAKDSWPRCQAPRKSAPKIFCRKCCKATEDFGHSLFFVCEEANQAYSPTYEEEESSVRPSNHEEDSGHKQGTKNSSTRKSKIRLPPENIQNKMQAMLASCQSTQEKNPKKQKEEGHKKTRHPQNTTHYKDDNRKGNRKGSRLSSGDKEEEDIEPESEVIA